jgi:hypothetical protein
MALKKVVSLVSERYGLIRVSTEEQNEARQVIAMTKLGIPKKNIVIDNRTVVCGFLECRNLMTIKR